MAFEGETLPALTVRQPWASATAFPGERAKLIENRTRRPPKALLGQRVAIHAGLRVDGEAVSRAEALLGCSLPNILPRGAVLAVARLAGVYCPWDEVEPLMVFAGGRPPSRHPSADPWYVPGMVGWLWSDVHVLVAPVPCRGAQQHGWRLPPDVHGAVMAQLGGRI